MSPALLVSGAWQLRHGEPVSPGSALIALSPVTLRRPDDPFAMVSVGIDGAARPGAMPLAVIGRGGAAAPVTHLVHALDVGRALLARVDEPSGPSRPVEDRIADLYAAWHLRLNNNECYYTAGPARERSFDLRADVSPWALAEELYAAADDGAWAPFVPRFRVPPRAWLADISIFRATAPGRPLVVASAYGRRRGSWDERVVTAELVSPLPDGSLSRGARHEVRTDGAALEIALADFAGGALRSAGRRIRLAAELQVESLRGGHLFAVTVECLRDPADPDWCAAVARVVYEKTRGSVVAGLAEDEAALCGHIAQTLASCGVVALPGPDRLLGRLPAVDICP